MFQSKYTGLEIEVKLDKVETIPTKISELINDSNYVSLEVVQQMIDDAIANLNKPEEPDTPTENIGSITEDNSIVIDETQFENGTYVLKYIDTNDNIVDNFNEIASFEINK